MDSAPSAAPSSSGRERKRSVRAVEAAANAKERSDSVSKARRGKVRPDADLSYSDEADDSETEGQKRQRVAPAAARSGSARKELAGLALPAGVKSPPKEIAPKEVACLALAEGETVEVCFVRQGKKLWRSGTVVTVENQAGTCVAFVKSEQFSEGKRVVDLHQLDWRRPVTEPPVVPKPRVPQQPTAADIAAAAVTAAARAAAAAAAATAAEPGGADEALWDVYEKV